MSVVRKIYMGRLMGRCLVLAACVLLCIMRPLQLKVLEGFHFFKDITVLHILWLVWVIDMLVQILPVKSMISIGSQKHFARYYAPAPQDTDTCDLQQYTTASRKSAYMIFFIWAVMTAVLGVLYHGKIVGNIGLFIISVIFYVCDLICVLIWCPFRLLLKNRCCTTCRIFNWDHLMMFSPLIFIKGFFTWSLVAMAVIVWIIWELSIWFHPERFWEGANSTLKCSNCTDKLCTQYCEKRTSWE